MEWVRAATLAPSVYNTQPWKFALGSGSVQIYPDLKRALGIVDPHHRQLYISLGCALENLCLSALQDGFTSTVEYLPWDQRNCAARVEFAAEAMTSSLLADVIPRRQLNRRPYDRRPLDAATIQALDNVPVEAGVSVRLITERAPFVFFAELVAFADRRLLQNPGYVDEMLEWMRFNPKELARTKDGLSAGEFHEPVISRWLGESMFRHRMKPETQAAQDMALVHSASALLVIATETDDRLSWLAAGRTLERIELEATKLGLQHAYLNQPCVVPDVRDQLVPRLGPKGNFPQMVLRLGYAPPGPRSLRRPLEDVLIEPEPTPLYVSPPTREDGNVPFYP